VFSSGLQPSGRVVVGDQPAVLCVSHDPALVATVRQSLVGLPIGVRESSSSAEALVRALSEPVQLVIVVDDLPDASGLGFCRSLREHPELKDVPILLISSHASESDRILAFETGVDDFLARPFFPRELASRVQAVLRRSRRGQPVADARPRRLGALTFDAGRCIVEVEGRRLGLTRTEFEILGVLVRNEGRVLARRDLVSLVWGASGPGNDRVVDVHVKAIRRKLGPARDYLQTVRGVGYRFDAAARR
jgi:two-component system phosphate regulon response regulator PhoB